MLYLSDISRMPKPTLEYIKSWAKETGISVLILDSLLYNRAHSTHFGLDQAAELVKVLKPKSTYLVGMSCDSFPPHDEANKALAEKVRSARTSSPTYPASLHQSSSQAST